MTDAAASAPAAEFIKTPQAEPQAPPSVLSTVWSGFKHGLVKYGAPFGAGVFIGLLSVLVQVKNGKKP